MSQLPPLEPPSHAPAPGAVLPAPLSDQRRPWSAGEKIAWVVILVAVALTVWSVMQVRQAAAAAGGARGGEARTQLLLSSRYAIGLNNAMKILGRGAAPGAGSDVALRQLVSGLDEQAKGPEDRLRAAIVRAEVEGAQAGITQLDHIADQWPAMANDVATLRRLYTQEPVGGEEWKTLHDRYGWFADLASSHGKPETDPARAAVVSAGYRTMAAMILIVLLALGAAVVGAVLLIVAIFLLRSGKLQRAFDRQVRLPGDRRAYVEAFALFLGGWVGASLILRTAARQEWLSASAASMLGMGAMLLAFVAGMMWPLFRGQRWDAWRAVLGLHRGRGVVREIFAGFVGYLAGFPVLIAGVLMTLVLLKFTSSDASHPIVRQLGGGPLVWTAVFLLATVWAPVSEELMFRGMLLSHLRERFGWWVSAPVVGVIFALIHPQGWAAAPVLTAIAVVLAGIREWRGSIVGSIAAHALHNGVALLMVTLMLT